MTDEQIQERDLALACKAEKLIEDAVEPGEDAFASTMAIAEVLLARGILRVTENPLDQMTACSMISRHIWGMLTANDRDTLLRSIQ